MLRTTLAIAFLLACTQFATAAEPTKFTVSADRGVDLGQNFGTLFQAVSADGKLVLGAGFQNVYNTRYRGDRHAVQFYIRPTDGVRTFQTEALPRPNSLCGTYMYGRDGKLISTYGGVRSWNAKAGRWDEETELGGTSETMRVGNGLLEFGESWVKFDGQLILPAPERGSYQLFFYANGHLCFYHVNRGDGPYRAYENDEDGFSKLYACPWQPGGGAIDLAQATVRTLPYVGETTFAWGQLGKQVVTGSNLGGFYVFTDGHWTMLLEPRLGVSYQLYSTMAFHDRLLMGQYPTGRIFEYDGTKITDLKDWPPKLQGVSGSSREAQTTIIYGGDVLVGVWPWGELWRYNSDSTRWAFMQRMFDHPAPTDTVTHPYDIENLGNAIGNLWGQRVTSLVTNGSDLFVSTSAKHPCEWDAQLYPFLAPDKWQSYGRVYRITMPGHLGAPTRWTGNATTFEFLIGDRDISISQDGQVLAATELDEKTTALLRNGLTGTKVSWGDGIYGRFTGPSIQGSLTVGK